MRVPLINSSLTDCVFEVKCKTTMEEVNALLKVKSDSLASRPDSLRAHLAGPSLRAFVCQLFTQLTASCTSRLSAPSAHPNFANASCKANTMLRGI